jgi:hypothetical protein
VTHDATRAYKDVIGELTAAADALRERDRVRAAALARRLVDIDAEMVRAEQRAALSRLGVELQYDAVLDALWDEEWMTLKPRPRPDPRADPERLDALDEAAARAAAAVMDTVRRRFGGLGRR